MNASTYPNLAGRGLLCLFCAALVFTVPLARADQAAQERALIALEDFTGPADEAQLQYVYSAADGAAVRQKLETLLDMYEAMCRTMKMSGELATLAESRAYLGVLSNEHLSALTPVLPDLAGWSASATALTAHLRDVEQREELHSAHAASDSLPVVDYWEPNFPCVLGEVTPEAMITAFEVMQLANVVYGVLSHVCGLTIKGFNVEYICIFVGAPVFYVAEAIFENIKYCSDGQTESIVTTTYDRTEHLHHDLADVQGSVDSTQNSVDSMMTILEKMLADQSRQLYMQIEINLAGHGVHPHPIAMFQLPATLGGYLDTARTIVVHTIETMRNLGESVHQAEIKLAMGDDDYAMGDYKGAYVRYSQAYRYATRAHGCMTAESNDVVPVDQ